MSCRTGQYCWCHTPFVYTLLTKDLCLVRTGQYCWYHTFPTGNWDPRQLRGINSLNLGCPDCPDYVLTLGMHQDSRDELGHNCFILPSCSYCFCLFWFLPIVLSCPGTISWQEQTEAGPAMQILTVDFNLHILQQLYFGSIIAKTLIFNNNQQKVVGFLI